MKLTRSLPLLVCASVATARSAFRRGICNDAWEFASRPYDYIVIGGGTAGLVVAARLAEDKGVTVGVIEAGEYRPNDELMHTPMLASRLQRNTTYDWMFATVAQSDLKGASLNLPRGKVLGGSSAIDLMWYTRAPKAEYDAWAALGNDGWDWDGLLPYMKASEGFTNADPFRVNHTESNPRDILAHQGTNGPIAISYNTWYSDLVVPYIKATTELGIPYNFNPDNGNPYGTLNSPASVNRKIGQRSYSGNTYYANNAHRDNLVVLTGAQATKIELYDEDNDGVVTATGVSFVHNSTTFTVTARKEVILSAGSIQTPQLLELSGIGDKELLGQYGIKTHVDLPGVGENLQDHIRVATTYELKPGVTTWDIMRVNPEYAAAAQKQYASTHDGILASSIGTLSFIGLDDITSSEKIKEITARLEQEIKEDPISKLQEKQYEIQKQWLTKNKGHIEIILNPIYFGAGTAKNETSYMTLAVVPQHPFSRGYIHINSTNPLAPPQIDPKYLSKTIDQDSLVEAVKLSSKISKTGPLADIVVGRQDPPESATSDDEIIDYIKTFARSIHQQIGTAAMAPRDIGGVVDKDLKVYGTTNLRVVDASIIPLHMSAHIARTLYGIAEKASDIIKKAN